jgi:hypothetical protein
MQSTIGRLLLLGLTDDELRRVFENELVKARAQRQLAVGGGKS